jgi:hypothetical protein
VAQAFHESGHEIPGQEAWLRIARSHPRIVGLMWFLYPSYEHGGKSYQGSRSSQKVLGAQRRLGREVLCGTGNAADRGKCLAYDGRGKRLTADVDGDGVDDLVIRRDDGGEVDVFLGQGGGQLDYRGAWTYGYGTTYDILVGDVTGDGRADLVARHRKTGEVTVGVAGDETFAAPRRWTYGYGQTYSLDLQDINGDGREDLVASTRGRRVVGISTGSGFSSPS